jgi:hypothetical protein
MAVEMIAATVQAGTVATPYFRAGRGAPVILLTNQTAAALVNDPVLEVLVENFRVIVPTLPETENRNGAWLQGLIDGLGCNGVRVIIDAHGFDDEEISALT